MNGLFKILSLTVPAVAIVIFLTYHQQQEHKVEMRKDSAIFDRDWNEQMADFAKSKTDKAKYKQRAAEAQTELNIQEIEFQEKKMAVDHLGREMDKATSDLNKEGYELQKELKERH